MRLSIRGLFGLTFLVALGLLVWKTGLETRRDELRMQVLKEEIELSQQGLRLDSPALHQAILRAEDEFDSMAALRERSESHFESLREKYSTMEARGANVLSLRGVPSLKTGAGPAPIVFRLLVPTERPVWLKFGVHTIQPSQFSRSVFPEEDLVSQSPFEASGPFEVRLASGDHKLTITIGTATNGALPVTLKLDDGILLQTDYVSATVSGTSSSHVSGISQIDVRPKRALPWLITAHLDDDNPPAPKYGFSIALSEQSSEFAVFPGESKMD